MALKVRAIFDQDYCLNNFWDAHLRTLCVTVRILKSSIIHPSIATIINYAIMIRLFRTVHLGNHLKNFSSNKKSYKIWQPYFVLFSLQITLYYMYLYFYEVKMGWHLSLLVYCYDLRYRSIYIYERIKCEYRCTVKGPKVTDDTTCTNVQAWFNTLHTIT